MSFCKLTLACTEPSQRQRIPPWRKGYWQEWREKQGTIPPPVFLCSPVRVPNKQHVNKQVFLYLSTGAVELWRTDTTRNKSACLFQWLLIESKSYGHLKNCKCGAGSLLKTRFCYCSWSDIKDHSLKKDKNWANILNSCSARLASPCRAAICTFTWSEKMQRVQSVTIARASSTVAPLRRSPRDSTRGMLPTCQS